MFKLNKKELFIVFLIFLLAFGIRAHLMKYELMFEFDTYFHARAASYIIQGNFTEIDPQAYWQKPNGQPFGSSQLFFWYFTALIYKIFTLNAPYNKELWIFFVKLLPALFGALTAIAMFYLGKEFFGRKAGYASALIAAVVPAFVYRTMAGFFEDDSLGFLWLVIGLVFLARAIKEPELKKQNYFNAILAGIFFGIMAWTWGFFEFIPILLTAYIFSGLILFYLVKREQLKEFIALNLISFFVFAVLATIKDKGYWFFVAVDNVLNLLNINNSSNIFIFGFFILILAFFVFLLMQASKNVKIRSPFILVCLLYIFLLGVAFIIFDPLTIFKPKFVATDVLSATIGEESFGLPNFPHKYNLLIVIPILALILIPYRILKDKEKMHLSLIAFFWIAFSLILAFYKLKYTYLFGLPIAIGAAFLSFEFFKSFDKPKLFETKFVALMFSFLLLTGIAAGTMFVSKNYPHIETSQAYWKPALNWIKENTPKNAKFFNWWNYGHWLTFIGERTALIDNRNADLEADSNFASFITALNLKDAIKIMQYYKPDYVIVEHELFQSSGSLLVYAFWTTNTSDPRIASIAPGFFGFSMPCSKENNLFKCSGNTLSEQQMNSIKAEWHSEPDDVIQGQIPAWYYRNKDNSAIFLLGPNSNKAMLARLWFNEPKAMQFFEEVYSNYGLKIFKVKPIAFTVNLNSIDESLDTNST